MITEQCGEQTPWRQENPQEGKRTFTKTVRIVDGKKWHFKNEETNNIKKEAGLLQYEGCQVFNVGGQEKG